jgi:holliday junction DNA helicase RuvA
VIGRLAGRLLEKRPPQIVVDVQGIGYELDVPMSTFYNLPSVEGQVVLFTHFVVREDAHLLFGFGSETERQAFRQMLKVSGVGPKLALSVLSGLSVADLATAVASQEAGRLVKIPGVGKKTAERLILELRDKLEAVAEGSATGARRGEIKPKSDIANALVALGYNDREVEWTMKQLTPEIGVSDGIRQALKLLSKA